MENSLNQIKHENYRVQLRRLNQALHYDFNLEAIFIEYAIMEDRTESILHHADKWDSYIKKRKGRNPTIDSKVKYIQKLSEKKKSLLNKYFSSDLLDRILEWKEDRNRLIHALLKQQLANNELTAFALQGKSLVDELRTKSRSYNRAEERQKARELG